VYLARVFRSSSFQLTSLSALWFCLAASILVAVTYIYAEKYVREDETEELDVDFTRIVEEARPSDFATLPQIISQRIHERGSEHSIYLLEDSSGRFIAGNVQAIKPREGPIQLDRPAMDNPRYTIAEGHILQNGEFLLLGQDLTQLEDLQAVLIRAFVASIGLTIVLAIVGGMLISRNVLRRVAIATATSRAIVAGDLSQRIPLRGTDDEFDQLASGVNAMLDRIVELMEHTRQVANDIAHDLRTPLTRLRQRLERARKDEGSQELRIDVLDRSIEDVDAILKTFSALLRISQIEAGGQTNSLAAVDFSSLLNGIVGDFAPAARDRGQQLRARIEPGLLVYGDRELLMQMAVNLLDNALLHCAAGTTVNVTVDDVGGAPRLTIADNGRGIPQEERESVFRPFYRLEPSRHSEGSGLGLSLVAAITRQHGASIALEDNGPGLRVVVGFQSMRGIAMVVGPSTLEAHAT